MKDFSNLSLSEFVSARCLPQTSVMRKSSAEMERDMDQILLCSHHIPLTTSISNSFIQRYMLDANGSYVKVYLYLSMCIQSGEKNLSISSLADQMENTEKDILRALRYWEKKGLMSLQRNDSGSSITGIEMINPDDLEQPETEDKLSAVTEIPPEDDTDTEKETEELSVTEKPTAHVSENADFSWTCLIVESYLERPLNASEVQLLTYLFDSLNFSKELILHLYEYCCSLSKTNVKYVQAVALSWARENITTPEQAKEHSANYSAAHTAIAKTLGLGRSLAKIECAYVERWQNEWHMDLAVILEACNRTMLSIQKADFKYIEGILSNWHKENVHTLQDVRVCDEMHSRKKAQQYHAAQTTQAASKADKAASAKRTQFQTFQQRDTSREEIDQLEKMLLTR